MSKDFKDSVKVYGSPTELYLAMPCFMCQVFMNKTCYNTSLSPCRRVTIKYLTYSMR